MTTTLALPSETQVQKYKDQILERGGQIREVKGGIQVGFGNGLKTLIFKRLNGYTKFTFYENMPKKYAKLLGLEEPKEDITVICYNQPTIFTSRKSAREEVMNWIACSEGSERDRYLNVLFDLDEGKKVCTDDDKW